MPLLVAGAALFAASGFAADQVGDAAEQTSNSAIKLILVGGAAWFILKKTKVI